MLEYLPSFSKEWGASSANKERKLFHEVNILYNLLPTTQWVHLAAIIVVFGILLRSIEFPLLLTWLGIVLAILASRILISRQYQRANKTPATAQFWFQWFLIGTTLYGIMWSTTAILLVPIDSSGITGFTALMLCALAAGGVAVSSVNLKVFLVYAISTMWPYATCLIIGGSNTQQLTGWLMYAFSLILVAMALHINGFFANLIQLQLKTMLLEKEIQVENKKRQLAEKALLDNTLEEELVDLIRQQSQSLKNTERKYISANTDMDSDINNINEYGYNNDYFNLLNEKFINQLVSAKIFLEDLQKNNLTNKQKNDLNIVEKILLNMISGFKRLTGDDRSKIENEQILNKELQYGPINLRHTINYIKHDIPLVYKAKLISVNQNINETIPRMVYGDEEIIKHILKHLILNAFKYSDEGTIEISINAVPLDEDGGIEIYFKIRDNGIGIPQEVVDFLQNEASLPERPNTGLVTVKKLLLLVNGKFITIQTAMGGGTTIELMIPFTIKEKHPEERLIVNS